MRLPFTEEQFLAVFSHYNTDLALAVALLWLGSVIAVLVAVSRPADRLIGALLTIHWLWSGAVYHLRYFVEINPAARVFGVAFLVQAALFAWFGWFRPRLSSRPGPRSWQRLAVIVILYALAYPFVVLASGLRWPAMPTFGVPCPTTILTTGVLIGATNMPRGLAVIPLLWSMIGGSAAILLGITPDYGLIVAGVLLLVRIVWKRDSSAPAA